MKNKQKSINPFLTAEKYVRKETRRWYDIFILREEFTVNLATNITGICILFGTFMGFIDTALSFYACIVCFVTILMNVIYTSFIRNILILNREKRFIDFCLNHENDVRQRLQDEEEINSYSNVDEDGNLNNFKVL